MCNLVKALLYKNVLWCHSCIVYGVFLFLLWLKLELNSTFKEQKTTKTVQLWLHQRTFVFSSAFRENFKLRGKRVKPPRLSVISRPWIEFEWLDKSRLSYEGRIDSKLFFQANTSSKKNQQIRLLSLSF